MHRFFVSPAALTSATVSLHEPELVHQLGRVLRMRVGDRVILLDGGGRECVVELSSITPKEIRGHIIEKRAHDAEPATRITLVQALPKNQSKFEAVLQHGTELGVTHFIPLLSERTEAVSLRNLDRLHRIIRESAEQSERGILPTLGEPIDFMTLTQQPLPGMALIADSYTTEPPLGALLPNLRSQTELHLFVGPEGGFSEAEITTARRAGWQPFSLGPRILRTETAGLAIVSAFLLG